jgi:hypothetical protein
MQVTRGFRGMVAESPSAFERSPRFLDRRYDSSEQHKKFSVFQEFLVNSTRESRIVLQKAMAQGVCAGRRLLSESIRARQRFQRC